MSSLTRLTATASAFLLYVLTRGPDRLHDPVIRILISRRLDIKKVKDALRTLILTGVFFEFNNLLNAWARNNWRVRNKERWDWKSEVAVVTGGSGAIGGLVVKGLADKGVKVAVLDVQPLPDS